MSLDFRKIRKDFPILDQQVHGKPLAYLDNAATTQKPRVVLDKVEEYYLKTNANIHRGAHFMANETTEAFEGARETVRQYIKAGDRGEIIFTHGTTESVNLVAYSFGEAFVSEGDEIVVSELEHHANIVPWQLLCERKKATLKVLPFDEKGVLKIEELDGLLTERTKLVAMNHVSNTLGTINPVEKIVEISHKRNIPVLLDGAQGIAHYPPDVQTLDCDFYVFSGHKIYGPTGIGVLYGKRKWLEQMPPFMGGGEMISEVKFSGTTFNELPYKFEPGTPNYIGAIALGTAIEYVQSLGVDNLAVREQEILKLATEKLKSIEGIRFFGEAENKVGVISFEIEGIHSFDLGTLLDQLGIAVRTGRMCTDPIMDHFDVPGMTRASFAFYNTEEEVEALYKALIRIKGMF
ncbi:cysteine desulfurase [Prolixibacter denitrificans]|uniref:Cysteine desulfurase n=1 Tax=Prolixibacter denitrificans TaxID=1541063 RepID=A0A2P8CI89_9BACT|nr:cysteine desulfurase [Prolixibacter denitrificans]PSK84688.1 cysteine desulfurase/selenocysteine lyase [Prolixibacter denitrificans]GET20854.1 cysteine desulfurase [Prolixibacter denitrificans]